jgi:hypothetical protein
MPFPARVKTSEEGESDATAYAFITSDNSVAIHQSPNLLEPMTRYVPITPAICLSVLYDRTELPPFDPTLPPQGAVKWASVTDHGAKFINKLVAQSAVADAFGAEPSANAGLSSTRAPLPILSEKSVSSTLEGARAYRRAPRFSGVALWSPAG